MAIEFIGGEVSYVASGLDSAASSINVKVPPGIKNDFLVMVVFNTSGHILYLNHNAVATLSGWTSYRSNVGSDYVGGIGDDALYCGFMYRVDDGTVDSCIKVTQSGSDNNFWMAYVTRWRGVDPTTPIDNTISATGVDWTQSTNPWSSTRGDMINYVRCPSVTTTTANCAVIRMGVVEGLGFSDNVETITTPSGASNEYHYNLRDAATDGGASAPGDQDCAGFCFGWSTQASAGATDVYDWSWTGNHEESRGITIALRPGGSSDSGITHVGTSYSYDNDAGTSTIAVDIPSGATGDYLVGVVATGNTSSTVSPPTGWSGISMGTLSTPPGHEVFYMYRKDDGTVGSTVSVDFTDNCQLVALMTRWRGVDGTDPIDNTLKTSGPYTSASNPNAQGISATTSKQNDITTTEDACAVLRFGTADADVFCASQYTITSAFSGSETAEYGYVRCNRDDGASSTYWTGVGFTWNKKATAGTVDSHTWSFAMGSDDTTGITFALVPGSAGGGGGTTYAPAAALIGL